MSKELITKKDYEILGIKENSTPSEINSAYEKLLQEYHPEKIKLEKYREPNDLEIKKYKEVEKVYKKFVDNSHLEVEKYICQGWKKGGGFCENFFYPCLWEKNEGGHRKRFCSQECYNSKNENPIDKRTEEWNQQKLQKAKKLLEKVKVQKINYIKRELEHAKVKSEELEPNNRDFEQEINSVFVQNADDSDYLNRLYDISDRITKDIYSKKKEEKIYCDNCNKEIKKRREGNTEWVGMGSVDNEGNQYTFCSKECSKKGMRGKGKRVIRKNPFTELLKWMEREGITNISLDPGNGKLILEYGKNNAKTIEDSNLTSEQREIKKFFQQIGKTSLSQNEARAKAETEEKSNNDNKWVKPLVVGGIIVVVITLIGIIIYKNKKKGY